MPRYFGGRTRKGRKMLDERLGKQFGVEDTFGRYRNISWDLSPLRRRYLEEKYDLTQKRMMNILRYNLTGALKYDLLNTIAKPKTVDLNAIGSKGSGKSVLLLKLHEEHYRKLYDIPATERLDSEDIMYIIERVFFIQDYLIRYVKQNPKLNTTCLQLDERAQTLGDSSYANMKRITNLTETLRKRRINFFYASPKLRWNFEYEYVIEPLEMNDEYKILHSVIFDKDMRLLGSLYTKKCDDHLETEYEKIKEEFMTAVSEGKLRTLEYEDMAFSVLEAFPEIEEMYNESSEYEQEKQRYMMLSPKERRSAGRPMPPEERLTANKLIYCINKVNADYTGTEKVMIMEEIKHIMHNRKMEKKGKAEAPNIKLIKEAAKEGAEEKGSIVELDDEDDDSISKENKNMEESL